MAKKVQDDDEPTTPAEKTVNATPPVTRDPLKAVAIETGIPGQYRYLDGDELDASGAFESAVKADGEVIQTHARTMAVGGKHYEHTHEDADGCWVYRQM